MLSEILRRKDKFIPACWSVTSSLAHHIVCDIKLTTSFGLYLNFTITPAIRGGLGSLLTTLLLY